MAFDFTAKLEAINKELQQIANNYNEASQVVKNCEQKIFELKGAKAQLEEILKDIDTQEQPTI
tara:strand:- start:58 stop:246 length:189 start_codon:yes stop_codon:yes gene_type:complete